MDARRPRKLATELVARAACALCATTVSWMTTTCHRRGAGAATIKPNVPVPFSSFCCAPFFFCLGLLQFSHDCVGFNCEKIVVQIEQLASMN
jgi:hypothetical protein